MKTYVVGPTRFERDDICVPHKEGLAEWLGKGYWLRMSNYSPSLIRHASISKETPE
jgi:hypothetical protein